MKKVEKEASILVLQKLKYGKISGGVHYAKSKDSR